MLQKYVEVEREEVPCAICGCIGPILLFEVKGGSLYFGDQRKDLKGLERIVRCPSCGLVYVNPRLVITAQVTTYSEAEETEYFRSTSPYRSANYDTLIKMIERSKAKGNILDVGFGDALFLRSAEVRGWAVWGVELRQRLVRSAKERFGLSNLFEGELGSVTALWPSRFFDVVVLLNVIEHIRHPSQAMAEVERLLKEDGLVVIHTCNFGGLQARLAGKKWQHFCPFEHLYYFTYDTLKRLLEKNSLRVTGRFSFKSSSALKCLVQRVLETGGLYVDNSLGVLASNIG